MARTARVVVAAVPHHVTQRGNNRNPIFLADTDRVRYLKILQQESARHGLRILGYCLMTNHVHLVVIPDSKESLSKGLGRTNYGYTRSFQARYGGCGHLWQQRPWSCPMDESYSISALVYTELNPVRARMVQSPEEYLWSSARAHLTGRDRTGLLDMNWWAARGLSPDWRDRLSAGVGDHIVANLRGALVRGSPCGDEEFVKRIEIQTGRQFGPEIPRAGAEAARGTVTLRDCPH